MQITTIQGVIENGQVKLTEAVEISEKTVVYVVVPSVQLSQAARIRSPRAVGREELESLEREVIELENDEI